MTPETKEIIERLIEYSATEVERLNALTESMLDGTSKEMVKIKKKQVLADIAKVGAMLDSGGWIKSSEQLPEIGEYVLVYIRNRGLWIVRRFDFEEARWRRTDGKLEMYHHWMPLPPAPKGFENAEPETK